MTRRSRPVTIRRSKTKQRKQKMNDTELNELSPKSYKLHLDIKASKDKHKRARLRAERERTIKLIIRKQLSNSQKQLSHRGKNTTRNFKRRLRQIGGVLPSNKIYKQQQTYKLKQPLCVQDESGNVVRTEKDQAETISHDFCHHLLAPNDSATCSMCHDNTLQLRWNV